VLLVVGRRRVGKEEGVREWNLMAVRGFEIVGAWSRLSGARIFGNWCWCFVVLWCCSLG
jgi:hypothetical protein